MIVKHALQENTVTHQHNPLVLVTVLLAITVPVVQPAPPLFCQIQQGHVFQAIIAQKSLDHLPRALEVLTLHQS